MVLGLKIEFATAVVGGIGIVVRYTFPTKVVISALQSSGDILRPRCINRILKRLALVMRRQPGVPAHGGGHPDDRNDSANDV